MSVASTLNTGYLDRTTGWANADPTTILCWFRLNSVSGTHTIWDHGDGTSFAPQLWTSGNQLIVTAAATINDTITTVAANTWYFTATVFNGTGNLVTVWFGQQNTALGNNTSSVNFGGFTGTVLTVYNELNHDQVLNGRVTGLKLWNGAGGALSQDEVLNEFRKFQPSKTTALYGAYPYLNATTSPGIDMSGNARDLTLHGTVSSQREMPAIPWLGEP